MMTIQVKSLPKNNKNPLLISVDYDADEDGNCKKTFAESVAQGSTLDVDDDIGHAILAKYAKFVSTKVDASKTPKNKMSEGASKTA